MNFLNIFKTPQSQIKQQFLDKNVNKVILSSTSNTYNYDNSSKDCKYNEAISGVYTPYITGASFGTGNYHWTNQKHYFISGSCIATGKMN